MHDWFKKNQKKLLAVLGAMLMVTFLINTGPSAGNGGSHSKGLPIGKMGKTVLYSLDKRQASDEWSILATKTMDVNAYRMQREFVSPLDQLGKTIDLQVRDHPELFLLLIKEAEQRGIAISADTLGSVMQNQFRSQYPNTDPLYQDAIRHFLMVKILRDQLAGDVKFSEPMWKRELAETANQTALNLVEFSTDQFKFSTSAPTTQQVQSLFNDYRHLQPNHAATNPSDALGLGYEVPNRVKLQYLSISRKQAFDAAKAARNAYDLDVEAREYYLRNSSKFVRVAPATLPATLPATAPATQTAATTQPSTTQAATTQPATIPAIASTQPTTRPYAEVKDEIFATLIDPDAEKLQQQVAKALHDRLAGDYAAYRLSNPTTAPSTQPSTSAIAGAATQPAPYTSYGYLEGVALDIQRQFNILPQVRQIAEWEDADQLAKEPGIGSAEIDSRKFPQIAAQDAAPFAGSSASATALHLWQPSDLLTDVDHSIYEFRLTDADPAHAPSFADVQTRVEADALVKSTYESAEAAANKFVEEARKTSFSRATLATNRPMTSTGNFDPHSVVGREGAIPNFKASKETTAAVAHKAEDLLQQATVADPHPIGVIPLPAEHKVIVVQLADVTMNRPESGYYFQKMDTAQRYEQSDSEIIAASYFTYANVCARLDFHPDESTKTANP